MKESMKHKVRVRLTLAAICVFGATANPLHAASITWGTPTTISSESDVSTSGLSVYAYSFNQSQEINSVFFLKGSANISLSGIGFVAGMGSASDPYNSLTTAYKNIVGAGSTGSGPTTITLKNLTVGHNYLVQVWINDSRGTGAGRTADLSSAGGNTVTIDFNSTDADGGVGQYSIGTFTSDSVSQVFVITNGVDQLNTIQLRDLSATPTPIEWESAVTISSDSDVLTEGTLLYSYTFGTAQTINTVPFAKSGGLADFGGGNITATGFSGSSGTAFGVASPPYTTLTSAYQNIIKGGAYGGGEAATLTLNNLTVGNQYKVQVWLNDSRGGNGAGKIEWVSSLGGNTVKLDANSTEADGGVGQYAIGTFVASSTEQVFSIMHPDGIQLNAIQVRSVPYAGTVIIIR